MVRTVRRTAAALAAAVALIAATAACTITITPGEGWVVVDGPTVGSGVIERFESVRSVYAVGERVSFRIATRERGYVTLTAIDPDGRVYVIARNLLVAGGRTQVLPAADARIAFVAVPPTGRHVVRAHFTPARTPETVVFEGVVGIDAWFGRISLELRGTGYTLDDTAETRFTIAR